MTQSPRRSTLGWTLALLALSLVTALTYLHLDQRRAAAASATRACSEAEQLARRIEALRRRPSLAGTQELQLAEMARRIESAATAAAMTPAAHILSIWPQPARRVADTVYLEKPTQVLLRQATLKQITQFLHHLTQTGLGLHCASIRLTSPTPSPAPGSLGSAAPGSVGTNVSSNSANSNETWSADLTLTYLIYSPPRTQPAHGR